MYLYGRGSPRRGSRKVSVGRGSPRRGSRKRDTEIKWAHKNPQHKIPLYKSIQYKYETPKILRSIFSTDSCLQYDNGVSTSNSPPARNIVMICPDYYIETYIPKYQNTTEFFLYPNLENKNVALAKTLNSIPCFCKHTHDH